MQTFETADANVCVKMHTRLRENAHIFGSMGKMQLLHGAFGNTDGIPPLDNPIFVRLFTCCFIKSCTFVRLNWKGGQIRGIPNHNISPATSYLDTYLQTTKKDNYNGKLHFGEQA